METKLNITGMSCEHCVKAVENALSSVPGVKRVTVDLSGATATVAGHASQDAMIAAVLGEGYKAARAE